MNMISISRQLYLVSRLGHSVEELSLMPALPHCPTLALLGIMNYCVLLESASNHLNMVSIYFDI